MDNLIIRKPTVNDVPQILELINGYANAQMMLNKSHYRIYTTLQNFIVAEHNNKICGCCALSILWADLGEICSLAVSADYLKQGIGSELVKACINEAKNTDFPES